MLESNFFKRSRPDFRRFESFGFRMHDGAYEYCEDLPDNQFRAVLRVTEDGAVTGKVIDLETNEEYLPIRLKDPHGSFSAAIREMYIEFLAKAGQACFVPVHFIFDQSNRMEARISSEFGAEAEFPWEKYPGNGIFRCPENGKWFAALLTVEYGKLSASECTTDIAVSSDTAVRDENEIVEVINLKANPDDIPKLIRTPGIYPAWHMNKKHWISVLLDDTLSDAHVFDLIRSSHALVAEGKPSRARSTGAWMIPSNPGVYDVDAGFRRGGGEIEWHQHNNILTGDEVYIYCSAPYSALIYRCEVVAADLNYRGMFKESKGYDRAMRIRLIEKYPPDKYPLSFIRAHGGSVVRSARRMPEELHAAIRKSV